MLHRAEQRAAKAEADRIALAKLHQQEEQTRLRDAAVEAERRLEEERRVNATPESTTAVESAGAGDDNQKRQRRMALQRKPTSGWTPLSGGPSSGFSFERAARSLVRGMTTDSAKEDPYLYEANRRPSAPSIMSGSDNNQGPTSYLLLDYGLDQPQASFDSLPFNPLISIALTCAILIVAYAYAFELSF